ncbi:hypothetical protein RYX36_030383 [Vicia faba]
MAAEGTASPKKSLNLKKAFFENGTRVLSQAEEYLTKHKSITTFNQIPKLNAIAVPTYPNANLNSKTQEVTPWKHKTIKELIRNDTLRLEKTCKGFENC